MSAARDDARCAALLACFRSEQMSAAQWQGHLREEPGLREYVEEQRAAGNEPTDADLIARFNATPLVPHHYRLGMLRYVDQGIEPGGFLCAVIDNDLTEAVGRADDEGLAALRDIVRWFYNEAPGPCWGSVDRRLSWVAEHNEKRRRAAAARA